jgi:hypothetical protein
MEFNNNNNNNVTSTTGGVVTPEGFNKTMLHLSINTPPNSAPPINQQFTTQSTLHQSNNAPPIHTTTLHQSINDPPIDVPPSNAPPINQQFTNQSTLHQTTLDQSINAPSINQRSTLNAPPNPHIHRPINQQLNECYSNMHNCE